MENEYQEIVNIEYENYFELHNELRKLSPTQTARISRKPAQSPLYKRFKKIIDYYLPIFQSRGDKIINQMQKKWKHRLLYQYHNKPTYCKIENVEKGKKLNTFRE
jgi:hypothetical protein